MPLPPRQLSPEAAEGPEDSECRSAQACVSPVHDRAIRLEPSDDECEHLEQVTVRRPLEDGTLGLLLHGGMVAGFTGPGVEEAGWVVGDRIVEVAGQGVGSFGEFVTRLQTAQAEGYPIRFGVLRRGRAATAASAVGSGDNPIPSEHQPAGGEPQEAAEEALASFFGGTTLTDLADKLQGKFGVAPRLAEDGKAASSSSTRLGDDESLLSSRSSAVMDNPYVQALQRRRDELFRSVEGWSSEVAASLASRLATERSDALATFVRPPRETPRASASSVLPDLSAPLAAWGTCIPTSADGACRARRAADCTGCEATPTPRVDLDADVLACQVAWQLRREAASPSKARGQAPRNLVAPMPPSR